MFPNQLFSEELFDFRLPRPLLVILGLRSTNTAQLNSLLASGLQPENDGVGAHYPSHGGIDLVASGNRALHVALVEAQPVILCMLLGLS